MAFSMIASKKAAPVAALISKLAFNDARALQAASVQSTRSFNTNSRELEALDDESKLGCGSDRDNDVPYSSRSALNLSSQSDRTKYFTSAAAAPVAFPLSKRVGWYEIEDENRLEMRMDMPGLGKEHVKLSMEQYTLTIIGDGGDEIGEEDGARRYYNRIDFPGVYGYKLNEIEAEMKSGILKIVVPKGKEEETDDVFHINVK